jgi:hypothetical protein
MVLRDERGASREACRAGQTDRAAAILEETARRDDLPDVFRTVLLTRAGEIRQQAGDAAGARRSYEAALGHVACRETIRCRIGLAVLDLTARKPRSALEHLRAAVREGSGASVEIGRCASSVLRPLFESSDAAVREEVRRLADVERADEPLRVELRAACERASRKGKLVLLHWYAPYSAYSMALEERLAHPEVRARIAKGLVHFRVDLGLHHRAISLEQEYGHVMREYGVPCFYVLEPDGSILSIQPERDLLGPGTRSYRLDLLTEWLDSVIPE